MDEPKIADSSSLTGVWDGLYRQPGRKQHVSFAAMLIDTGSLISGSTHETGTASYCPIKTHYATVSGDARGAGDYSHQVL